MKKIPLYKTLKADSEFKTITLPCGHTFHKPCLAKYIYYNNRECPLCRAQIPVKELEPLIVRLQNIAVPTRPSPESLALGMRPDGWCNVQIQVIPPKGRKIKSLMYVFHPAFSLNKLVTTKPPFDLVMKLVSNSVQVVIQMEFTDGEKFAFVHNMVKELCSREYMIGVWNGIDNEEKISHISIKSISQISFTTSSSNQTTYYKPIDPLTYFQDKLQEYNRDDNYYITEMPPPPRFKDSQKRGIISFIKHLFQG